MKKMLTVDYDEYMKYNTVVEKLRSDITKLENQNRILSDELSFIKNSGENILVINKDEFTKYEYKTTDKNVVVDIISENEKILALYRKCFDEYVSSIKYQNDIINENIMLKNRLVEYQKYSSKLINRNLVERIINKRLR